MTELLESSWETKTYSIDDVHFDHNDYEYQQDAYTERNRQASQVREGSDPTWFGEAPQEHQGLGEEELCISEYLWMFEHQCTAS